MKFAISAAAVLAFIGSAFAQATDGFDAITYPTDQALLSPGSTYTVTWDPTASYNGQTVSIILLEGATQSSLLLGPTIAGGIDSALGQFSWTVDSSVVGSALYGLKLQLDSDPTIFQYSFPFYIQASTTTATSASTTAIVSTTTSASTSATSASSISNVGVSSGSSITTVTSASITSTTQVTTTSTVASTTATGSATGGGAPTTLTTLSKPASTGSPTASASPTFVTAGAAKVAAGSFMAIGGVMAAVLAI